MKNKIFLLTIIVSLLFSVIPVTFAESVSCEYDKVNLVVTFEKSGDTIKSKFNQDFFPKKDTPWWINWLVNNRSGKVKENENLKTQVPELFGMCPSKIYTCKYEEYSFNSGLKVFFSGEAGTLLHLRQVYLYYSKEEMERENKELSSVSNNWEWEGKVGVLEAIIEGWEKWSSMADKDTFFYYLLGIFGASNGLGLEALTSLWDGENIAFKRKLCESAEYTGDLLTYNLACPNSAVYLGRLVKAKTKYDNCSGASCAQYISEMNEHEQSLKSYCKSILQEQNYVGDTEKECIDECFNIRDKILKIKGIEDVESDCGLSSRLLVLLSNILKWVKYILPVIVIVLGILDFIKAIASEKEDEMKKAQKGFITRLIAAALVFIIPLIIEFILIKMGFTYDACSLFDYK